MITFQNIDTQHIFILPDKKAIEIINQAPDMYKIISGIEKDILMFNKQYSNLEVKCINNLHDRYIIIDRIYLYHIGASLKDLGNKIFSINRLDTKLIDVLLNKIKERDEVYESL